MSPPPATREPPRLLTRTGGLSFGLAVVVLLMSMIATLDIIAVTASIRSAAGLPARLAGEMTLATVGGDIESSDAAAARGAEILLATPGVARAWVLDPRPGDDLLGRLMGLGNSAPVTEAPASARLIATDLTPGSRVTGAELAERLGRHGLKVAVDDHHPWSGPVERTALLAATGAAAILLMMIAAVWIAVGSAARRAVASQAGRVKLLIHLGASERMLGWRFRDGMILTALIGSLVGAALIGAIAAVLIWSPNAAIWLAARGIETPSLRGVDLSGALLWPVLATVVGVLAAGGAVKGALRKLS